MILGMKNAVSKTVYFSVLIPPAKKDATEWHPTHPTETLSRGAFKTRKEAHEWASAHISGHTYRVKRYAY